jgi:general secretion pathway protein D
MRGLRNFSVLVLFVTAVLVFPALGQEGGRGDVFPSSESYVNFSFDEVGIATFVKLVGNVTGKKFVMGNGVDGSITVVSPKILANEVYPLFLTILESAGCSVIQEREIYRVVKLADRPTLMAPVVGVGEDVPIAGVITKIFRVEHIAASELRRMLEAKVRGGRSGAVAAIEETNHLVITDTSESIRNIEKLIREIDQPGLASMTEVVTLKFADAKDVARELTDMMLPAESRADRLKRRVPAVPGSQEERRRMVSIVASPHANSLLLVGSTAQLKELKETISKIDVEKPEGRGRLHVIPLRYILAEDAAKTLKALLQKNPASPGVETVGGEIAIEASKASNALLVNSTPNDFASISNLISQLDHLPPQVHIEVLIAELTQGDSYELGVDLAAVDLPSSLGDSIVQGSSTLDGDASTILNAVQKGIFPGGLTVGVAHGSRLDAAGNIEVGYPGILSINAVRKDTRFRILSNPSLVAQDNHEASVSIVNEIPVLTSTIEGGSGTSRDVIQNIERVDVGIKLKLTPHIIPGGKVRMDLNPSIEAIIDSGPTGTPFTPTIARREVHTTVTVADGKMIVIAGLTREDERETIRKFPILGSIPFIGWIFTRTTESREKTNLLIFVTPTIVTDDAVASALKESMSEASGLFHDESP